MQPPSFWGTAVCHVIYKTRETVSSGYPNTEKIVENAARSGVFLTKFEVFGYPRSRVFDRYSQYSQSKQKLRSKQKSKIVKLKVYAN